MKLNRKWIMTIALVLSMTMAVSGTLAYLTDHESKTNTFTMGKVDIEVEEVFEPNSLIKPGQTVKKEAQIINNGNKGAWVWMTVSVPETLKDYVTLNWTDDYKDKVTGPEVVDDEAVWTVLVDEELASNGETGNILASVTLSSLVDYQKVDETFKYVIIQNGEPVAVEGLDENNNLIVTVTGYAVQTDGLDTVNKAYKAYNKQWGMEIPDDPTVTYNGTTYLTVYEAVAAANENGGGEIELNGSATLDKPLEIKSNITLKGDGAAYTRADGYTGTMISVGDGVTFTAEEIILDGAGATATGNLIYAEGSNSAIVLNEGTVLQNNNGAHAVNLGTRAGNTLTLNGAHIINNSSDSGAIWGGGHITVNEGSKINNNSSTGSAGAIRMVSNCNLTMNGGEISNNTAAASGGAIWGYGASTYNFNGGKMSGNTAAAGGAMYTGDSSTVNISGTFEMTDNSANDAGAMRLSNRTALNMSGGKISGNESKNDSAWDGFYGWNPGVNISGGELVDDVCIQGGLTPTIGGSGITGVIHFDLSTNHNTANLAKDFGTIKFTVANDANFAAFNFKPASDYTYTAGDESKLVCMNEGYSTYWDTTTNTFKIKATV